ncbi:MAG: hypothetical protein U0L05_03395 [Schaedlerella sp.]|nr:hypothetical protein [Schaedlerella sp.]
MRRRRWKNIMIQKLYCKPKWNEKFRCIRCSLDEVIVILGKGRDCRK